MITQSINYHYLPLSTRFYVPILYQYLFSNCPCHNYQGNLAITLTNHFAKINLIIFPQTLVKFQHYPGVRVTKVLLYIYTMLQTPVKYKSDLKKISIFSKITTFLNGKINERSFSNTSHSRYLSYTCDEMVSFFKAFSRQLWGIQLCGHWLKSLHQYHVILHKMGPTNSPPNLCNFGSHLLVDVK